jgi:hypothetical protein
VLAAQFDCDLVRELPQEGDGLAEIRQCTVNHAGFRLGAQRDLDAEALERCHDDAFPALAPCLQLLSVLGRVRRTGRRDHGGGDACEQVVDPPLCCSTRGGSLPCWGVARGCALFHIPTDFVVAQEASEVESSSRLDVL